MEINVKIKTDYNRMKEFFECDELISVRYYEETETKGIFKAIIRIPECDLKIKGIQNIERLKEKIVRACNDEFLTYDVCLKNGIKRKIYVTTNYWKEESIKDIESFHKSKRLFEI